MRPNLSRRELSVGVLLDAVGSTSVTQQLFLQLLALGLLTSVTPWGIVAVIVLLSAKSRPGGAVAFVAGWVVSILLVGGLVIGLYRGTHSRPGSSATDAMLGVQFGLGILLLALAARKWRRRIAADPSATEPTWLKRLDRMRPIVAFGFGMFWINLVFVVAAALAVADAKLSRAAAVTAYLFYALLATLGVAAILAVYYADQTRAQQRLAGMRSWLARNNTGVVSAVVAAIGVAFIVRALAGIAS
jgi:Sap, sulfolipid-1-addressing protein